MHLREVPLYMQDLAEAAASMDLSPLNGQKVLITGATGLIGSAVVDLLLHYNRTANAGLTVYAASRSCANVQRRFPDVGEADGLVPVEYDATQPITLDFPVDYIIHAASNATPNAYVAQPVETMMANVMGIYELMQYATRANAKRVMYVSSSEVYGNMPKAEALEEGDYGYVDLLNLRSSYPMGKRAAETLCFCYAGEYQLDTVIVRPGHIYGPTATGSDMRISSDFARKAAAGENLVMKSAGTQMRSYCHCLDCATAILTVLLKGECGQAYNISNKNAVINIRDMAALLAKAGGVQLVQEIPDSAAKAAFNPMDNSSLNAEKLEALGWEGVFDAEKGLSGTVQILRCIQ